MLKVENIACEYRDKKVLQDVSFQLNKGEIACLLGPSGCGKTTLLNAIAGFLPIQNGAISVENTVISDRSNIVPPEKRNIGVVFQDYALFPHLSIEQNVGFGVKSKNGKADLVADLLKQVRLTEHAKKYPHELSGGQQQRVAIARSLAAKPTILLLDEPFSNLDNDLRVNLREELAQILKAQEITSLLVTHDQQDAFAIGDKTGVMSNGELHQWADAYELYHHPETEFVANFVGEGAFISGEMVNQRSVLTEFGLLKGQTVTQDLNNKNVKILIRPDDVLISTDSPLNLEITAKSFRGANIFYTLKHDNNECINALLPSHDDFEVGDFMRVSIDTEHLVVFPS